MLFRSPLLALTCSASQRICKARATARAALDGGAAPAGWSTALYEDLDAIELEISRAGSLAAKVRRARHPPQSAAARRPRRSPGHVLEALARAAAARAKTGLGCARPPPTHTPISPSRRCHLPPSPPHLPLLTQMPHQDQLIRELISSASLEKEALVPLGARPLLHEKLQLGGGGPPAGSASSADRRTAPEPDLREYILRAAVPRPDVSGAVPTAQRMYVPLQEQHFRLAVALSVDHDAS